MNTYDLLLLFAFFYIYSFIGWLIESSIVSIQEKRLVNRGFLRGPFLPIYGTGALVIIMATSPVSYNPFLVYIFGLVSSTVLEYIVGWLMELLFKTKLWDYSRERFNFKGRICLLSSLFWGFLSLFLVYVLHQYIQGLVKSVNPRLLFVICFIVSVYIIFDIIVSSKTVLDINKLLANITRIKTEINQHLEQFSDKLLHNGHNQPVDKKIEKKKKEYVYQINRIGFFAQKFIRSNPSVYSKNFNEALNEIKEKVVAKGKKKNK